MKRNYESGESKDVSYFFGREVEHTPAFGMETLFVVGLKEVNDIEEMLSKATYDTDHIFFGANHSFNPVSGIDYINWEDMIKHFLSQDYLCSLDIPISAVENFNDGGLCDYDNFIPQIRIPVPYIKLWNYNTMIKIDDKDFDATNPGVWTHSLHNLLDRNKFTSWREYSKDEIIK